MKEGDSGEVDFQFEIGQILHLKSESRNLKLDWLHFQRLQSNSQFRMSDLRCRIRPISN